MEVVIPADKELIKAYFECDSLGTIQMKKIEQLEAGKNVKAKIIVKENTIYVDCEVDTFLVYSIYKSRYESISSDVTKDSIKVETSTEKRRTLPWWVYPALVGGVLAGFGIGRLRI